MSRVLSKCAGAALAMLWLFGADGAPVAQTVKSQSITQPVAKEVAQALELEQRAEALAAQGRVAEAEALYKQSLAVVEQSLPNDPILAGSLNNVAHFYRSQRRKQEAAPLFDRALAIYVSAYGDNHTLTAMVIHNLAEMYLEDRNFDAAEPLYRRGLAVTETLLGRDHYAVAISLDWLAQTNFGQRRFVEAEGHLRRGLAIAENSAGPESQLVARLLDHLVSVLAAQDREQEAAALKERAQRIIAKSPKR
jgi:tetratricopeptide (TPR) repeat protein